MRIISKFYDYYDCIMRQGMDRETIYMRKEISEKKAPISVPVIHYNDGYELSLFLIGFCGQIYTGARTNCGENVEYIYGKEEILAYIEEHKLRVSYYHQTRMDEAFNHKIKDWKHPIFVATINSHWQDRFIWNAKLGDWNFQKVMDPYTAFQELQMWVASQARPEKAMIETSDETRLEAHGFDKKFSFRKEKQKKRKR